MITEETKLILEAYEILGKLTPLKTDCGRLCNGACCEGDSETGMLLFPGEEELYKNDTDFNLLDTDYGCMLLVCSGKCNREKRPLSCRIFPLAIVSKNGFTKVIADPRSRAMCPLYRNAVNQRLDAEFTKAVKQVAKLLSANERMIEFAELTNELCNRFSGL